MQWISEEKMTSGQRKLKRGIEHVRTLCSETSAFEEAGAYSFDWARDLRSPQEALYRCYADQREAPPGHWPLLAGEAIQNLRSALDHLVYEAAEGKGKTQFPIFTKIDDYRKKGKPMIKTVPEEMWDSIESIQPFSFMPEHADQHPLAILHALSNLDKHRVLATVVSAVTHEGVGIPEGVELNWKNPATNKEIGAGRTPISTFVVRAEGGVADVEVEPMFSYEVRVERRPVGTLKEIGNTVYRAYFEVDRGEKAPPMLPHPL